ARQGHHAAELLNGPLDIQIVVGYGLGFVPAGLVVRLDPRYPMWLGTDQRRDSEEAPSSRAWRPWPSCRSVGAGLSLDRLVLVLTLPMDSIWMLLLGTHMWRRFERPVTGAAAAPPP